MAKEHRNPKTFDLPYQMTTAIRGLECKFPLNLQAQSILHESTRNGYQPNQTSTRKKRSIPFIKPIDTWHI
jgi:hypothetical protein